MSKMILVAGPWRSGTNGDETLMRQNLARLEQAALALFERGHVPVIGEWLALPLAQAAGSEKPGDAISERFYTRSRTVWWRNATRCCVCRARPRGLTVMWKSPASTGLRFTFRWRTCRRDNARYCTSGTTTGQKPAAVPALDYPIAPLHRIEEEFRHLRFAQIKLLHALRNPLPVVLLIAFIKIQQRAERATAV